MSVLRSGLAGLCFGADAAVVNSLLTCILPTRVCNIYNKLLHRWYDKNNVKPAFPFGHGLTYGAMSYSNLNVAGRTVTFTLEGTGCDTPQVYISYPTASTDPRVPTKVMRYFQKVCSTSAESSTTVSYTFNDKDVSNWDLTSKKWSVTTGIYGVMVGSSSQDIRLKSFFTV